MIFVITEEMEVKVMGIDLAGLEKNITGICVLVPNHELELCSVRRDEEIIKKSGGGRTCCHSHRRTAVLLWKTFQGLRPRDKEILQHSAFDFPGDETAYGARHEIDGDYQ